MWHMTNAAVAAVEEQECRSLLEKLLRECDPEAEVEHAKHARTHTQAVCLSKSAKAGQSSRPRAARE